MHLFRHLEVHSAPRIVEIGVHGHDGHIVLHRLYDRALHIVVAREVGQAAEDERMVSHNQVAALTDGLVDNRLGHV